MKTTNNDLREIMKTAWQFTKQTGINFAECLRKAWKVFKLKVQMLNGIVKFYYTKVDGSIREAWGTLQNVEDKIKGDNRAKNPTVQVYFDTEVNDFRCFKKLNLV